MSARKPVGLVKKHIKIADRMKRTDSEAALRPKEPLRKKPPTRLTGHPVASALWIKMITMYFSLNTEIVSRLDQDTLVDYCILYEQSEELDQLRRVAIQDHSKAQKYLEKKSRDKELDPNILIKLMNSVDWCMGSIVKLDGRADRKRSLMHTLRQSLYLTPRSRAGVAPQEKPPEEPKSEMAKILDGDDFP